MDKEKLRRVVAHPEATRDALEALLSEVEQLPAVQAHLLLGGHLHNYGTQQHEVPDVEGALKVAKQMQSNPDVQLFIQISEALRTSFPAKKN